MRWRGAAALVCSTSGMSGEVAPSRVVHHSSAVADAASVTSRGFRAQCLKALRRGKRRMRS